MASEAFTLINSNDDAIVLSGHTSYFRPNYYYYYCANNIASLGVVSILWSQVPLMMRMTIGTITNYQ